MSELIDRKRFSADMRDFQNRVGIWRDEAEDTETRTRADAALATIIETKLILDKQPTIPASPWHRVEDELPPMLYQAEGDDFCIDYSLLVLAYREASHDFYLARQMDDGHGATWGTDCFDELYGVTHWMPLPEPPKEDA